MKNKVSKLKLPQISPMIGAGPGIFLKVTHKRKISLSKWLKFILTFIIIILSTPFRIPDILYFKHRLKNYKLSPSPLFIIGHWRSGTTFLHNTMTKDRRAGYVTTYQSVFPNHLRMKPFFEIFMRQLMPEYRPGDNIKMGIDYPQEDEYALSNMTSCSFYHFFNFPGSYKEFYKKYVRFNETTSKNLLEWQDKYIELIKKAGIYTHGILPIMKNPVNTGRIRHLLQLFPDARFIHIVRNPVYVYCSTKKFFSAVIPALDFQNITSEEISNMIFWLYENLMKDYLRDRELIAKHNLYEIRYEDVISQPQAVIDNIFEQLNLGGTMEDKSEINSYLLNQRTHKTDSYIITKNELDTILNKWDFAMKAWDYQVPGDIEVIT